MREATARGPSIDIGEFERRLRGGEPPADASASDPLAELARLLHGEETAPEADPYGRVFAAEPRRAPPVARPDDFATAPLRGALPPQPSAAHVTADDYYAVDPETEWEHSQSQDYLDYGDEAYAEEPAERKGFFRSLGERLRPWHAVVGLSAVGALSVALALGHRGGIVAPREIATIKAPEGPAKVQPSAVAETAGPQRGAAVLDRSQNAPVSKVVSSREQPVDPAAAIRVVRLGDGPVDAPHEPATPAPSSYNSEPKRVKTVSVRPDGTVIDDDAPPAPAILRSAPTPAPPAARAPTAPRADVAEPAAPTATPKSAKPPATTPPATTPAAGAAQAPRRRPAAAAPAPAAENAAPAEQTAAIAAPAEEAGTRGGFAVQFSAAASEEEARRTMSKIASKYNAALGGRRLGFRVAKIGERSVYRVRAAGMSREAAVGVCEKVKASGGDCFVAAD